MKKTLAILISALIAALMLIPAFAADEMPGLIITEILRNPQGNDTYESFEIMNASDVAIDLYDYKIYCRKGASADENAAVAAADVTLWTYLSSAPGEVVLAPGELAMVWCVYSDCYKKADPTYGGFVKDIGDGKVEYNFDAYRNDMVTDSGCALDPSVKVLVNDKTGGKYFETGVAVAEHGFNLENSGAVRMWVCPREGDITSATCIIDSTSASKGIPTSYEPQSGTPLMKAVDSELFTPGTLDEKQTSLLSLVASLQKPETTAPAVTEAPAETTEASAPVTEAPAETTGDPAPVTGDSNIWLMLVIAAAGAAVTAVLTVSRSRKMGNA